MRPSQLKRRLLKNAEIGQATCVLSPPGCGKSEITKQAAMELGWDGKTYWTDMFKQFGPEPMTEVIKKRSAKQAEYIVDKFVEENGFSFIDFRGGLHEPPDLVGIYKVVEERQVSMLFPPHWFPTKGRGWFHVDEITTCRPDMQNALLQLCLDRRAGGVPLGDGWIISASGNRIEDKAHVVRLSSALSTRFNQLILEPSVDDSWSFAINNKWHPSVPAYFRHRPDNLFNMVGDGQKPFANPRSWFFTSRSLLAGMDRDEELEVISGFVGEPVATEFVPYLRVYESLVTPQQIEKDPLRAPVPPDSEISAIYMICGALVQITTVSNVEGLMKYVNRLPLEFRMIYIKDILVKERALATVPVVRDWMLEYANYIV